MAEAVVATAYGSPDVLSLVEVPVELANTEQSSVRVALDALRMVRDLIVLRVRVGGRSYDLAPDDAPPHTVDARPGARGPGR